ncbi:hypothetical protein EJB05_18109, partial [Eragrostis curvula]
MQLWKELESVKRRLRRRDSSLPLLWGWFSFTLVATMSRRSEVFVYHTSLLFQFAPSTVTSSIGGGTVPTPGMYFLLTEGDSVVLDVARLSFMEGAPAAMDTKETTEEASRGVKEEEAREVVWREEEGKSIVFKLFPANNRAILTLYSGGNWNVTKSYHLEWLDHDNEDLASLLWGKELSSKMNFEGEMICSADCLELNPSLRQFNLTKLLGKRGEGRVHSCSNISGEYALKIINPSRHKRTQEPREVDIMSCLDHPHVVEFYQEYIRNQLDGDGVSMELDNTMLSTKDADVQPTSIPVTQMDCPALHGGSSKESDNSVRVTNLSKRIRDCDILELFRIYGDVTSAYVATDDSTGASR